MSVTLVSAVRAHGSLLARFTAAHPGSQVDGVLQDAGGEAVLVFVVTGATRSQADVLLHDLRAGHGQVEVLQDDGGAGLVGRARIDPRALESGSLRALFSFANRFQWPHIHARQGLLTVRAGVPRAVAAIEAALMRAYLHKRGLAAEVRVEDVAHVLPLRLQAWCGADAVGVGGAGLLAKV